MNDAVSPLRFANGTPEQGLEMKNIWRHAISSHYRLGRRLVTSAVVALCFGLVMVFGTLWLSWTLEGAAAAINDAGSLRMQTVRIALAMDQTRGQRASLPSLIDEVDATFTQLQQGVPARPLRLPQSEAVQAQFELVRLNWSERLRPLVLRAHTGEVPEQQALATYSRLLQDFMVEANTLVSLVEQQNSRDTALLRASQFGLIALMLAGCVAVIYLLYGWVIRPVEALRRGVAEMSRRNFSYRVPVEGHDELGELAQGFNDMAAQLNVQYADLERLVQEKTERLEIQNQQLATLYEFSAYLSQAGDIRIKSEGFLSRLIAHFGADGGTVRILNPGNNSIHITVHQGLSEALIKQEQCLHLGDCLCGEAAEKRITLVHDFRNIAIEHSLPCQQEGFASVAVAPISHAGKQLGIYTLHFQVPRLFSEDDHRLFTSLGQHLGVAIENQRLLAKTRELAIAEERNLVAQGLHDSIAQGLNFMKLQTQMLRDSIAREDREEVVQVLDLLELGVKESYDDVRELLTNFRVRVEDGDFPSALRAAAERFEKHTGIKTWVQVNDQGAPLPAEHQLQVLFVVQEALSNIRKHAHASQVVIEYSNRDDLEIVVRDDGAGFDLGSPHLQAEQHIGLKIMQERAQRLNAEFFIESKPSHGCVVRLKLKKENRVAA